MYGSDEPYRIQKERAQVAIKLTDGTVVSGFLFLSRRERLVDMLNDQRRFVPVQREDGSLVMLNKLSIQRVEPTEHGSQFEGQSPYEVLGLEPTADDASVKAAYRALVREFHPDRVTAAGLGEAFVRLAKDRIQRINAAYDQIVRERGFDAQ
ncbi:MAG: DnaJ domain-containing protein [Rhodospirillaceae bacterium]|nr:DnaJ domain-containing protein [Rhodospirillaceae bacterium]